eukprot:Awhi_evm1s9748
MNNLRALSLVNLPILQRVFARGGANLTPLRFNDIIARNLPMLAELYMSALSRADLLKGNKGEC